MRIRVVIASDIGSFVAVDPDGSYYVITLDDTRDIELGDDLEGTFNGHGSLFYSVHNVTRGEAVRICLENWECPLQAAVHSLVSLHPSGTPFKINGKSFASKSDDVVREICRDVSK